jgi:hypothetical protein
LANSSNEKPLTSYRDDAGEEYFGTSLSNNGTLQQQLALCRSGAIRNAESSGTDSEKRVLHALSY